MKDLFAWIKRSLGRDRAELRTKPRLEFESLEYRVTPATTLAVVAPVRVGEDGPDTIIFRFTRDFGIDAQRTFNLTVGGLAKVGEDFTVSGATSFTESYAQVTFEPGQSQVDFVIEPLSDTLYERDETITLLLFDGPFLTSAEATINDSDDDAAQIQTRVLNSNTHAPEDDSETMTLRFTRTGDASGSLTAPLIVGGTATVNVDYSVTGADAFTATSGVVTFAPGETVRDLVFHPTHDDEVEGNETISIDFAQGRVANLTIRENDDSPAIIVSVNTPTVDEDGGQPLVFTFTRTAGNIANELLATFGLSATAQVDIDFTLSGHTSFNFNQGTIAFAAGSDTAVLTATPIVDNTFELVEYVFVSGSDAIGAIVDAGNSVEVIGATTALENGADVFTLRFTRGNTSMAQTHAFRVEGSANAGIDYTITGGVFDGVNGSVAFAPGQAVVDLVLAPIDDPLLEGDETIQLKQFNLPFESTFTINDDNDAAPLMVNVVGPASVAEDSGQTMKVRFVRGGDTSQPLVVDFSVEGDALVNKDFTVQNADGYSTYAGRITIPAGTSYQDLIFIPENDGAAEGIETTTIIVDFISQSATLTFTDGRPTVSTDTGSSEVPEDSDFFMQFLIRRDGNHTGELVIPFTLGGTAKYGVDYTVTGATVIDDASGPFGSVVLLDGQSSLSLEIDPIADSDIELDETVQLILGASPDYGLSGAAAEVVIRDDEVVSFTISGTLFLDLAGRGQRPQTFAPLPPRTIYIDLNNDGVFQADEPHATTDATGAYQITGLATNTYRIRAVLFPLDIATNEATVSVTTQDRTDIDLGVRLNPVNNFIPLVPDLYDNAQGSSAERRIEALYHAVLDRGSDPAGKAGWVAQYNAGLPIATIARAFQKSREYAEKFVQQTYRQVLARDADAAGLDGWSAVVMSGRSTSDVIVGMMTSPEFLARHVSSADFIQATYHHILGRDGFDGVTGWQPFLANHSRAELVAKMLQSEEAHNRLVRSAYVTFLHRDPAPVELAGWYQALVQSGFTSTDFVAVFLDGEEFRTLAG